MPDLEILTDWQEIMLVPCVAIGGITVENCRPLVEAGADFLAVSAGVWRHPDGPGGGRRGFQRRDRRGLARMRRHRPRLALRRPPIGSAPFSDPFPQKDDP